MRRGGVGAADMPPLFPQPNPPRARLSILLATLGLCLAPDCVGAQIPSTRTTTNADIIAASVTEAAQRFGLPERWIYAVMRVESAGAVNATSPKGAMGLMQVMPQTWARLRARFGLGENAYDAHDNITGGTAYLRLLYDQFGMPGALAAYNAGAGRYSDFLTKGRALPLETRTYVAKIVPLMEGRLPQLRFANATPAVVRTRVLWTQASLFARQEKRDMDASALQKTGPSQNPIDDTGQAATTPAQQRHDRLFVALSGASAR